MVEEQQRDLVLIIFKVHDSKYGLQINSTYITWILINFLLAGNI